MSEAERRYYVALLFLVVLAVPTLTLGLGYGAVWVCLFVIPLITIVATARLKSSAECAGRRLIGGDRAVYLFVGCWTFLIVMLGFAILSAASSVVATMLRYVTSENGG